MKSFLSLIENIFLGKINVKYIDILWSLIVYSKSIWQVNQICTFASGVDLGGALQMVIALMNLLQLLYISQFQQIQHILTSALLAPFLNIRFQHGIMIFSFKEMSPAQQVLYRCRKKKLWGQ